MRLKRKIKEVRVGDIMVEWPSSIERQLFLLKFILGFYPQSLWGLPGSSAVKNPLAVQEIQETWVQSLGQEDPLEEEMANHSCIIAWKTPWTEEPCGLQSTGSQRVRHNWATEHTHMPPNL